MDEITNEVVANEVVVEAPVEVAEAVEDAVGGEVA